MTLIEKIAQELEAYELLAASYNFTVFESGAFFQGVKAIKCFSPSEILLQLKNGDVCIVGKYMQIKKWYKGDLAVIGQINSVAKKR